MQQIAAWLTGPWFRASLVMAALLLLPGTPLLSGAVAVLQVARRGFVPGLAPIAGAVALVALVVAVAGAGADPTGAVVMAASMLGGCAVLAGVMRRVGSLTLAMQVGLLVALLGVSGVFLAVDDPAAMWAGALQAALDMLAQRGLNFAQPDRLIALSVVMTGMAWAAAWYAVSIMLVLGHMLLVAAEPDKLSWGRFREVNLGRVIAIALAVMSVLAAVSQSQWLVNLAMLMLLAFGLHGVALVHRVVHRLRLPQLVLVVFYVLLLLPLPAQIVVVVSCSVCVAGYVDAWFNLDRLLPAGPDNN